MVRVMTATGDNGNGRKPLLTLQSAAGAPRDYFEIFGRRYDVVDVDALGLRERGALEGLTQRVQELERLAIQGEASAADETEWAEKLRLIVPRILPTLGDTLAELSNGQCQEIIGGFLVWRQTRNGTLGILAALISGSSSPASPASTGPGNGS